MRARSWNLMFAIGNSYNNFPHWTRNGIVKWDIDVLHTIRVITFIDCDMTHLISRSNVSVSIFFTQKKGEKQKET